MTQFRQCSGDVQVALAVTAAERPIRSKLLQQIEKKPTLAIEYCSVCNFRGRAAWLAQELLAALEDNVAGVTLVPLRTGVFDVRIDGELVFSRKEAGRSSRCATSRIRSPNRESIPAVTSVRKRKS